MKVKNNELVPFLSQILELSKLKLGGVLSYALIKNQKKLIRLQEDFTDAYKNICEKEAVTDEKLITNSNQNGFVYEGEGNKKEYTYKTPEIKKQVLDDIKALNEIENEVEIHKVDEKLITGLTDITPEQTFWLLKIFDIDY